MSGQTSTLQVFEQFDVHSHDDKHRAPPGLEPDTFYQRKRENRIELHVYIMKTQNNIYIIYKTNSHSAKS